MLNLLKSVHALWVDGVSGDDHDHGQVGVHQRQGAVLQLPSQDSLALIIYIISSIFFSLCLMFHIIS